MNYHASIPQSGEQAEVLKDKLTPKAIVAALNEHIVGQDDAKKAVAVALRNRWRRQQLSPELRDEVTPKNILMIGPTGCGSPATSSRKPFGSSATAAGTRSVPPPRKQRWTSS